jgi:hypothetical protein
MKTLLEIQKQLQAGAFEFTRHAFKRAIERNINEREIREAGINVTIIDDKYSPSYLLLGFTKANRALHFHISRVDSDRTKIITLYEPEQNEWIDYKTRRK